MLSEDRTWDLHNLIDLTPDGRSVVYLELETETSRRGTLKLYDTWDGTTTVLGEEQWHPGHWGGGDGWIHVDPLPGSQAQGYDLYRLDPAARSLQLIANGVDFTRSADDWSQVVWFTEDETLGVWSRTSGASIQLGTDVDRFSGASAAFFVSDARDWVAWSGGSGPDDGLHLHVFADGTTAVTPAGPTRAVYVTPDRSRVAFTDDAGVHLWTPATGAVETVHEASGEWVSLSTDQTQVAFVAFDGRTIRVDLTTGIESELASTGPYTRASASPSLDRVFIQQNAGGGPSGLWVWTAADGLLQISDGPASCGGPDDPDADFVIAADLVDPDAGGIVRWTAADSLQPLGGGYTFAPECVHIDGVALGRRTMDGQAPALWALDVVTADLTEVVPDAWVWRGHPATGSIVAARNVGDHHDWYHWAPGLPAVLMQEQSDGPPLDDQGSGIMPTGLPVTALAHWDGPTRTRTLFAPDAAPVVSGWTWATSRDYTTTVYVGTDGGFKEWRRDEGTVLPLDGEVRPFFAGTLQFPSDSYALITPDGSYTPQSPSGTLSLREHRQAEVEIATVADLESKGSDVYVFVTEDPDTAIRTLHVAHPE